MRADWQDERDHRAAAQAEHSRRDADPLTMPASIPWSAQVFSQRAATAIRGDLTDGEQVVIAAFATSHHYYGRPRFLALTDQRLFMVAGRKRLRSRLEKIDRIDTRETRLHLWLDIHINGKVMYRLRDIEPQGRAEELARAFRVLRERV